MSDSEAGSNRITLDSYEAAADLYVELNANAPPWLLEFMAKFTALLPPRAVVLEVGSGPGRDADLLEASGFQVRRTDATTAFVERMKARGVRADQLDLLTDDLGGPLAAVYANAVFLHLTDVELATVLVKVAKAMQPQGLLAFTVKEGDGAAWTSAKVGKTRFFQYWREPALRQLLDDTGWDVISVDQAVGRSDDWLLILCRVSTTRTGNRGIGRATMGQ